MVRVNTGSLGFLQPGGQRFMRLEEVSALTRPGSVASWDVSTDGRGSAASVSGRVCAIRKSDEAIRTAQVQLRRYAARKQMKLNPESLESAKFVIIFTTFPSSRFTPEEALDRCRVRWQVELAFKCLKSVAQLGHLPKRGCESSKAWLYGKLFAALLTEKLIAHASALSPWGYDFHALRAPSRAGGVSSGSH